MRSNLKQQPFPAQLVDLFLIELTNWRWAWRTMIITSMITPLLSMAAFGVFARDSGHESLVYILSGNVVLSLVFGTLDNVQGHFIYLRVMGTLDYFATLPIRRYIFILSVVVAFLALSLPALIVTMIAGSYLLGVALKPSPLILLVIPICATSLAGIGTLIGANAGTPEDSGSIGLLVAAAMLGIGPVIVPPDRLPGILVLLGRVNPATYAASAIRQTLVGPITPQFVLDIAVLLGFSIVSLVLVSAMMDWRQK
jgi:ABC-2 type transport system permease protein